MTETAVARIPPIEVTIEVEASLAGSPGDEPSLQGQFLCGDLEAGDLERLFAAYGVTVEFVPDGAEIPGSHWGAPEAGIIGAGTAGAKLYVRADTPVQSALHEGGHLLCADTERRVSLHTDAGGDDLEECGVCYLQVLFADQLPGVGRDRLCRDMDAWGYSFRLGSTRAWFEQDAEDGRAWLVEHGLLNADGQLTGRARR